MRVYKLALDPPWHERQVEWAAHFFPIDINELPGLLELRGARGAGESRKAHCSSVSMEAIHSGSRDV